MGKYPSWEERRLEDKVRRLAKISVLASKGYNPEDIKDMSLPELKLLYVGSEINDLAKKYNDSENGLKPGILKKYQKRHTQYLKQMKVVEKIFGSEKRAELVQKYHVSTDLSD